MSNSKLINVDMPNIAKSYNSSTGTTIETPRPDSKDLLALVTKHIEDGRIDVSGVQDADVAAYLMRPIVESAVHESTPSNGLRPTRVNVDTPGPIAALATNVISVKRPQRTLMTIGGVQTRSQYNAGSNELHRVLGQQGNLQFRNMLGDSHEYAINTDRRSRARASASLDTHTLGLRDALCNKYDIPDNFRGEIGRLRGIIRARETTISTRDTTIRTQHGELQQRETTIRTQHGEIQQLRGRIQQMEQELEHNRREVKRARSATQASRRRLQYSKKQSSSSSTSEGEDDQSDDQPDDGTAGRAANADRRTANVSPTPKKDNQGPEVP